MLLTSFRFLATALLTILVGCGGDDVACGPCVDGGTVSDSCCENGTADAGLDAAFTCDPVGQTGCGGAQACYGDASGTDYTYECSAPGNGTDGAACSVNSDCAAGFWCAKGGLNKCTHYCTTSQQCTASGSPTCVGNENGQPWGYCACITSDPPGIGTCP